MQQLFDIALIVLPDYWQVHLKSVIAETWYQEQAIQLPVINASSEHGYGTSIQARQESYRVTYSIATAASGAPPATLPGWA